MENKKIYKIDFALIVGTVLVSFIFMGMIGYRTPHVIAPIDNFSTTNSTILFSFENADSILIDDDENFTSPERIVVEEDLIINLEPGIYYWKLEGIVSSEVRKLEIISKIDLRMERGKDGNYILTNAGNVPLEIEVYDGMGWKKNFSLVQQYSENVSGIKFIGRQNE